MREVFVLLACRASFNIVGYPLVHVGPPVSFLGFVDCFIPAQVTGSRVVVHQGHDTVFHFCDGRDVGLPFRCDSCNGELPRI